jgi:putative flippase GtrA
MTIARHRILSEWIRFCIVGAASAALNTAIIILLTEAFDLHYIISTLLCFCIVNIFGFTYNRNWSFQVETAFLWKEPVCYTLVALVGIALTIWLSWMLVRAGLPYYAAVYATAALLAPYNFVAHRCLTFGVPKSEQG